MQRAAARVVQIQKYCVRTSPRILTTDPRPRADAVSDPLSVREFATRLLTHSPHGPQPQCRVSNPSERGWVTKIQSTAAAAQHGHGVTGIERVRQHYSIWTPAFHGVE